MDHEFYPYPAPEMMASYPPMEMDYDMRNYDDGRNYPFVGSLATGLAGGLLGGLLVPGLYGGFYGYPYAPYGGYYGYPYGGYPPYGGPWW